MLMWAWIAGLVAYTQNSQYSQGYYPPIPSSTPQVRAWLLSHGKLQAITQPQAASFPASAGSPLQADLDGDGLSETLRLADRVVAVAQPIGE